MTDPESLKMVLEGLARTALGLLILEFIGHDVSEQKRVVCMQYDLFAAMLEQLEVPAETPKGEGK